MVERISRGVLVTGASRGVGAATARAFAEHGDQVVVHFRGAEDRAREVLDSLPGDGHGILRADLTSPDETRALAAGAVEILGRVDVLVNNAALLLDPGAGGSKRGDHRVADTDYDSWVHVWRATLETNLMGPANLTYCVARHMIESPAAEGHPPGRIINVGSRGAYRGEPDIPAYGASKAGLHAFGQSMAVALAPHGIGVVSIAPGFIATDMAAPLLEGPAGDAIRAQSPFGRVATAPEVAAAICTLAEPGAEWVSGSVVDFNGASHLR